MLRSLLLALVATSSLVQASVIRRADETPIGYASQNGGTTGGAGGSTTTVSSLAEFTAAAAVKDANVIYVKGTISGATMVKVAGDTTILGVDSSSKLVGVGLSIKNVKNVIVRNLAISKVLADTGDAIAIQVAQNVWIDHMDLSSDLNNGKDYYDGLLDITHACDYVTVSNVYFHDHYKATLIGHSDSNADEDTGHLTVTYYNNYFKNINSRMPSIRFGTAHIFNSYYEGGDTGVNTRMGAQVLVQSCAFSGVKNPILSKDSDEVGYAVVNDCDLGGAENSAGKGTLTSVPYKYSLLGSGKVKSAVVGVAGNTLSFK